MAQRKRKKKKADETLVDLVEARDQAQGFVDQNQNLILGALVVIVLGVGGLFAYNNFIKKPKQNKAVAQMWKAEEQFQKDSFALALANPGGGYDGFNKLVEDYSGVTTGNSANYYAGISYLQLGQFEAAISYLNDTKAEGSILPIMKYGALGDAYSELSDFDRALTNYQKAANATKNEVLSPIYLMRFGLLNEKLEKYDAARKAYEKIKSEYPKSAQAREIDKYLIRIENK